MNQWVIENISPAVKNDLDNN